MPIPNYWLQLNAWQIVLHVLPFAGLLLLIAILPLIQASSQWWEHNRNKLAVAGTLGLAGIAFYFWPTHDWIRIATTYLDFLAFITLLASLFVVSGGIHISGAFAGFPRINTLFLALGAVLANLLGTTGASMLLIRPLLRANHHRRHKAHIVIFFIFIVSNCGGMLTPLGDPPLYLGFLRGVPFAWTFRLLPHWALMVGALLIIFHFLDEWHFMREDLETKGSLVDDVAASPHRLRLQGKRNLLLLAAILGVVVLSGTVLTSWLASRLSAGSALEASKAAQVLLLGAIAWLSFRWTKPAVHESNHFGFGPILEVAALFFGIFGAMLPVLAILEHRAPGFDLTQPWQYYWLTGVLSSFLDNTPTYISFAAMAAGQCGVSAEHLGELAARFPRLLEAVSVGAVFMGANTYIGNGPNFMVKAIAEHSRVKMPSFGGYLLWSAAVLVPLLLLESWIFFR